MDDGTNSGQHQLPESLIVNAAPSQILQNPHALEMHNTVLILSKQNSKLQSKIDALESKLELLTTENASLRALQKLLQLFDLS